MRLRLFAVCFASVLTVACVNFPTWGDSARQTPANRGQRIAETNCATCHAIATQGDSPNPEAPALRTIGRRYPVDSLEEAFGEGIVVGHPAMPQFQFSPDQVRDLIAYLDAIQR